ncbi:MAG TPA: ABC transporter permease [Chloroflexota bacterium]|nr:ABC transporter permease [Chloroflexota bacterium]
MAEEVTVSTAAVGIAQRRAQRKLGYHLRRVPPVVWLCGLIMVSMVLAAAFAPLLAPRDPFEQSLLLRLTPPSWLEEGEPGYLLGTDEFGRDILSRMLHGARVSLGIGLLGVSIGTALGSLLGMLAGYFAGPVDELIMWFADMQLAFPFILLAIAIIAVLGPDSGDLPIKLVIIVGISGWMTYARVCRAVVLTLKEREFVQAVNALGGSDGRILFRHILPNILSPIIVLATLDLARLIILESTLSFLGLGVQPPRPSWGGMLGQGREYLDTAWWLSTFPGLAIMLTTLAISRGGDWLRDVLDPTLRSG